MDGDIAPLPDIYEVAKKYDILLMVDDAHGEGVLGKGGRGIVDHFGLHGKVDVEVGTMSKAFGVVGGVVAGKSVIIEWLRQRGRPFLFSSAVTVPDAAACLAAVDLLEDSTQLVDKLWDNAKYFKAEMKNLGFNTGVSETPITPSCSAKRRWHNNSAASCSMRVCSPCRSASRPCRRARRASA
jgi:glycine C-acetyltransferase